MLCRLSLGLLASAISVAALPAIPQQEGSADDLGVMNISLKDVVKTTIGFQGAVQGAATTNQAGIGGLVLTSCLLMTTACGSLMPSRTSISLTEQARTASSTPVSLAPQSAPQRGWAHAG